MIKSGEQEIILYLWRTNQLGNYLSSTQLPSSYSYPMLNLRHEMLEKKVYSEKKFYQAMKRLKQMGLVLVHSNRKWFMSQTSTQAKEAIDYAEKHQGYGKKTFLKHIKILPKKQREFMMYHIESKGGENELKMASLIKYPNQKFCYLTPDGQFLGQILERAKLLDNAG